MIMYDKEYGLRSWGASSLVWCHPAATRGSGRRAIAPLVAIAVALTVAACDNASSGRAMRVAESTLASQWTKCGDSYYTLRDEQLMSKAAIVQMRGVRAAVTPLVVTEADKLNGIDWKGSAAFYARASREYRWEAVTYMIGGQYREGWNDWKAREDPFARVPVARVNGEWMAAPSGGEGWLSGMISAFSDIAGHAISCDDIPGVASTGARPAAASQGPDMEAALSKQPSPTGVIDTIASRRCAAQAAGRSHSRRSFVDRLLGRRKSVAKSLPDSQLMVTPEQDAIGAISYLATGEICVGANAVPFRVKPGMANYLSDYYILLSRPSSHGYRILTFGTVPVEYATDTRFYAWIVHPDSQRVLSGDLLSALPVGAALYLPQPGQWAPDGKLLTLVAEWISQDGSDVVTTLMSTDIPNPDGHIETVALLNAGGDVRVEPHSLEWPSTDVLHLTLQRERLSLQGPSGCQVDTVSVALRVDLARKSVSTAEPYSEDGGSPTALGCAAAGGDARVVSQLISAGADVNEGFGYKASHTPLMEAASHGHLGVVQALVAAGARLDVSEEGSGLTALGMAASKGHESVVRALIDAGAPLAGGGEYEPVPPLHAAAAAGNDAVVAILLDAGADPTEVHRGATALERARQSDHKKVVSVLIERIRNRDSTAGTPVGPEPVYPTQPTNAARRAPQEATATVARESGQVSRMRELLAESSHVWKGESWTASERWPMRLKVLTFDAPSGRLTGEVDWPSLEAVHSVSGALVGPTIVFTEMHYIRRGNAALGCTYELSLREERQLGGTWRCTTGHSGETLLTLR